MLITICGPSGSGKTMISRELLNNNVKEIVSYTTRPMRTGEIQGKDYNFIPLNTFKYLINSNSFCEFEEYSQSRFYGTTKQSICDALKSNEIYSVVVTPNGMRSIEKLIEDLKLDSNFLYKIFVNAPLGTRVNRYINRVGEDNFNFDDMNEINARVNRDFGMFLNIDKECDLIVQNDNHTNIKSLINYIYKQACCYFNENNLIYEQDYDNL